MRGAPSQLSSSDVDSEQRVWVQAVSWQTKGLPEEVRACRKGTPSLQGTQAEETRAGSVLDPRLEAVGISAELMNQTYPK